MKKVVISDVKTGPRKRKASQPSDNRIEGGKLSKSIGSKKDLFASDLHQFSVLQNFQPVLLFYDNVVERVFIKLTGIDGDYLAIDIRGKDRCSHCLLKQIIPLDINVGSDFLEKFQRFCSINGRATSEYFDAASFYMQKGDSQRFTEAARFITNNKTYNLGLRPLDIEKYIQLLKLIYQQTIASRASNFSGLCVACGIEVSDVFQEFDLRILDVADYYILIQLSNSENGCSHRILADRINTDLEGDLPQRTHSAGKLRRMNLLVQLHDMCEDAFIVCALQENAGRQIIEGFQKWSGVY